MVRSGLGDSARGVVCGMGREKIPGGQMTPRPHQGCRPLHPLPASRGPPVFL